MNKAITSFLKAALVIMGLTILLLCLFLLPELAGTAAAENPEFAYLKWPVLLGMYGAVIPFFIALYESWNLLIYIEGQTAFSDLSVRSLRRIRNCGIIIAVIFVAGMIGIGAAGALHPGILLMGAVIAFCSFVISVFAAVLKELLRSAIDMKAENELTI
jgi:quinol-cytochrome oxidoreductase complex cytochrome b subunit